MRPNDSYDDLLKMVEMHDDVLLRIENAIKKKQSIEACWLCYSCFESRVNRTLEKVSEHCPGRKCYQNPKVGIKRKIECLKRLRRLEYMGTEAFDSQTLAGIVEWCRERNTLVHALVTLNNYHGMDKKFLDLAKKGKLLVETIYKQTTVFRNGYYRLETVPEFPQKASEKCYLLKTKKKDLEDTENGKG